ncbi:polysaccharide deacetylase family protein [Brevundimonas sp.]|uniref:polysaccharide deacetylase family protein n=1 Tax=Brevundimonas sp. TaxID=1871086 RepID=UPI0025EB5FF7|nr:polysaccharide deacetylase family protein [Brevundimonas sp.]
MSAAVVEAYTPDLSLKGKLRRRWARLVSRRPLTADIDRPIVSFTFDDAPRSAVMQGAAVLECENVRGTFYVCGGLDGRTGPMGEYADLGAYRALAERGHEVACHTWSHLDCGKAGGDEIASDVALNREALAREGLVTHSFAYPYGDVSPQAKAALQGRFASLRALHPDLVRRGSDLNQLPAVGIEGPVGETRAEAWIDRALRQRAWLILYTHDVEASPSAWGCTPDALLRLVRRARAGGAQVAPVGDVLERLEQAA